MPNDKQIGRLPPHNDDAEVALLGSVLLRKKALDEVQSMLSKEDFYQPGHKLIWEGINGLRNDRPGITIDYVSLTQYMNQKGTLAEAGGAAYIADLTNRVPTSTNATYYAEIIRTASMKRQLFDLSIRIGDKAFDESSDIQESIDDLDSALSYLGTGVGTGTYEDAKRLIGEVVDNVHDIMEGKREIGVS
ncbi:MAG: DnaB-like helicase N-terminal domain-containing protein, partial [Lachnospiraceae bacterium]